MISPPNYVDNLGDIVDKFLKTIAHLILSPLYIIFFSCLFMLVIFIVPLSAFARWLFETDRPPTKDEYYGRF